MARNRNAANSPVPRGYEFAVTEDSSGGMFELHNRRDSNGRLFGVFSVAPGRKAEAGNYSLRVELRQEGRVLSRFTAPISVSERTQWDVYYERAVDFVLRTGRLTGRRQYTDSKVREFIAELEANDGAFADIAFYGAISDEELQAIGKKALGEELEEAANRIGALGKAYSKSTIYGTSGTAPERDRLRNAIYLALTRYVDHFPVDDFANRKALLFTDRTHQWEYSDPISGAAVLIFQDLISDREQGIERAGEVEDRLFSFLQQLNFDLPEAWRLPSHVRYYLPSRLDQSSGAWADANRHHRTRSWALMPVIWRDYNRPLTELPWWYGDYQPFAEAGTAILPEWRPRGSFSDLQAWLATTVRHAKRYGQSGLLPDGSISHHVGHRQDMAHWAYGFEWIAGTTLKAVSLLEDTPWRIGSDLYDQISNFILFAYPWLIYMDGIDFQTVGRSHYEARTSEFGSTRLVKGIDAVLEARSTDTVLANEDRLASLRSEVLDKTLQKGGNIAFWANDYMVHRKGGRSPYFMSVKMQSARTRGAESFEGSPNGIHNGSGVLQVKTDGNEYNSGRYRWDWHALPGVTEELRSDPTPKQSEANLFSPEFFAGAASNGESGLAAFRYSSENPYTSASANKGYFFFEDRALALGNGVTRVRNSDGSTNEPIITTVDQAAWDTEITYRLNGAQADSLAPAGADIDTSFEITGDSWFHQGGIGYVIFPRGKTSLALKGGAGVVDSYSADTDPGRVFHLAIDHGTNPDGSGADGQYAYMLVPNAAASEMPGLLKELKNSLEFINTPTAQGHLYSVGGQTLVQLAFYSPGTAAFANGMSVNVDKPALVQLHGAQDGWNIVVQNPEHHADKAAIAATRGFQHILLPGPNRITVGVNLSLQPGIYNYNTQGPDVRHLPGQTVDVSNNGRGASILTFNLPDRLDAPRYGYREELYAGMPASVDIPAK